LAIFRCRHNRCPDVVQHPAPTGATERKRNLEGLPLAAPKAVLLPQQNRQAFLVGVPQGETDEVLMLKYRSATLGKMACGLKVIRSDGRTLGWGVCFGRFFMWNVVTSGIPYINIVLMLVSSIMLGVDDEKRALHDRVCDTRVIYKQSVA
jgi:hypothetical protein